MEPFGSETHTLRYYACRQGPAHHGLLKTVVRGRAKLQTALEDWKYAAGGEGWKARCRSPGQEDNWPCPAI